jgi:hypothetical protein
MRYAKLAAIAAPALLLAAGCASTPHPPAACGTAVAAADYATGKNGTQDPSNDLRAASALRHANWPTTALRTDADQLAAAFTSFSTQDEPGYELASTGISGGIHRLLGACKR